MTLTWPEIVGDHPDYLYFKATGHTVIHRKDIHKPSAENYDEADGYVFDYDKLVEQAAGQEAMVRNFARFQNDLLRAGYTEDTKRIYVYRAINVVSGRLRDVHWSNIGSCWAYDLRGANIYQGRKAPPDQPYTRTSTLGVFLRGIVNVNDVNWAKTLHNKLMFPEEYEIRLKPGANIEIVGAMWYDSNPASIHHTGPKREMDWRAFHKNIRASVHEACGYDRWEPRK